MADPAFLLDSNSCIYILEGLSPGLRGAVESHEPGVIVTSTIVWAEVLRGINPQDGAAMRKSVRLFDVVPVLPFDLAAARAYQRVPFRRGRFNRLIAAHALALELTVVTNNPSDFADVEGLRVENWADGT